jgi:hypothetical protein
MRLLPPSCNLGSSAGVDFLSLPTCSGNWSRALLRDGSPRCPTQRTDPNTRIADLIRHSRSVTVDGVLDVVTPAGRGFNTLGGSWVASVLPSRP